VSHQEDNPQAHGNCNYDKVVRERGTYLIHKMWKVGQEHDVISIVWNKHARQEDGIGESTGRGSQQEGMGGGEAGARLALGYPLLCRVCSMVASRVCIESCGLKGVCGGTNLYVIG